MVQAVLEPLNELLIYISDLVAYYAFCLLFTRRQGEPMITGLHELSIHFQTMIYSNRWRYGFIFKSRLCSYVPHVAILVYGHVSDDYH